MNYIIKKLDISEYEKCNNIWDMAKFPLTEKFKEQIEDRNRVVFIYEVNGEFIGEIAYVLDMEDSDYTILNQRVYISRLIVKKKYRNQGIGSILTDHILDVIKKLGYKEATIGVDKDNTVALHLYRKKGFNTVLFDGTDEDSEYYKLLKRL